MGEVYLARQLGLERDVAVKLLAHIPADPGQDERIKERFRREAVALSRLRHPNTVQVIDYGFTGDDRPFIVTELLEGLGLDEVLIAEKVLGPERAIHIVTQIGMSLAEAHHHGIVHRDLKPSNIFLTQAFGKPDFVKVIDFGVARIHDGDSAVKQRALTVEGTTLGTPDYMAPEQARGNPPLPATDVYALGCMLYELLTGQPPFVGDSALQVMIAHIKDKPKLLRAARPDLDLPGELETLISQCLAKNAVERPLNAGTLVGMLEAIRDEMRLRSFAASQKRAAPPELDFEPDDRSRHEISQTNQRAPDSESSSQFRKPKGLRRGRQGRRADDGDYEDSQVGPLPDLSGMAPSSQPLSVEPVTGARSRPPGDANAPPAPSLVRARVPSQEEAPEMTVEATRLDLRPFFVEELEGPQARPPGHTIVQRPLRTRTPEPVENEKTPVPPSEASQPSARLVKKRGLPLPELRSRADTETRRHPTVKTGSGRWFVAGGLVATAIVVALIWSLSN